MHEEWSAVPIAIDLGILLAIHYVLTKHVLLLLLVMIDSPHRFLLSIKDCKNRYSWCELEIRM